MILLFAHMILNDIVKNIGAEIELSFTPLRTEFRFFFKIFNSTVGSFTIFTGLSSGKEIETLFGILCQST